MRRAKARWSRSSPGSVFPIQSRGLRQKRRFHLRGRYETCMCRSVPTRIAYYILLCGFFRWLPGSFLRRPRLFLLRGNFRRVLLPEQIGLLFVLFFELFRLSRVDPFREFNAARLQRVKRPCADLLVKPHIAPEALSLALNGFLLVCHPHSSPSVRPVEEGWFDPSIWEAPLRFDFRSPLARFFSFRSWL